MSPTALPLISASDYPAFQLIIPELKQTTFEEWQEDHVRAVAYRKGRNGSQDIPVSPAEFRRWLELNRTAPHLELLWACAEDIAKQSGKAASATP
jgi:hypothetical protein